MRMKTTQEIIKPCIKYKQIIFTEHWCKTKSQKWFSEEEIREAIDNSYLITNPKHISKKEFEKELFGKRE